MEHHFDIEIAQEVGILPAVLFNNIQHWIMKNQANGKHFHDGRYWTYNSMKAFQTQFPYVTCRQIETALNKLRDADLIMTGNYNAMQRDRTLWYALTDKSISISQNCEMHFTKTLDAFHQNVEPLPDNKPYIKQNTKDILSSDDDQVSKSTLDYGKVLHDFNTICTDFPNLKMITEKRKKKLQSLIKSLQGVLDEMKPEDKLQHIFQMAQKSDFLSGRNGKWTACNFDWIIEPSNAVKIIEGTYAKESANQQPITKTQNNKFNAFPQRDYDKNYYENLEEKLMNLDYFDKPDS